MPEGPETLRQTDLIRQTLSNNNKWMTFVGIKGVTKKAQTQNFDALRKCLELPIVDIFCKGKHYFIILANDMVIHAHHKMGGYWELKHSGDQVDNTHLHYVISFAFLDDQNHVIGDMVHLRYMNTRFGDFNIITMDEAQKKIDDIKPGFIGRYQHTEDSWLETIGNFGSRKTLTAALMEQDTLCSGIGNYLLAEILYEAKIHPKTLINSLTVDQKKALFHTCKQVIEGPYSGNRRKVIYGNTVCPLGHPISQDPRGDRTMWWVPKVQIIGVK